MKRFLLKIVHLSVDHPKKAVGLSVLLTIFFLLQMPFIRIDTDPENMLSDDEPVRVTHREVKKEFSLYDAFVLGITDESDPVGVFRKETLERIARITDEILKVDGVIARDLISPTTTDDIQAEGGTLRIEPLMDRSISDDAEALAVRDAALSNPILKDLLISEDGKALAIFVPIREKKMSYRIASEIRSIIEKYGGKEKYYITGLPVAEDTFGVEMFRQMAVSAPLAGLLIFLLMLFFFRKFSLVLSAMIVSMMAVIWAMGALVGLGFTVHIMSSMIPIFLMPIAVLDSVHILSEFHDRFRTGKDRRGTIVHAMEDLFTPMLFTSLTSAVGFGSLLLTPIPPVRVFGGFVAFGILAAWLLTITVIPAYIMLLPGKSLKKFGRVLSEGGLLTRAQKGLGRISIKYSKTVLSLCLVVLLVSIYGITKTRVNDNPVRWFHSGHPIRVAERVLNRHFGGTYMAYLVLEGEREGIMKDPAVLRYIEGLQKGLAEMDVVGKTTSVVDVVKKISFELNDENPGFNTVPDTPKKVAQYLFLYEMSGDPEDLYHLVDPSYSKVNIWVQLKSGDNQDMKKVEDMVRRRMETNPPPQGLSVRWAGLTYLNVIWQEKMVRGMLWSLAGGALAVFVMMVVLLRSFLWGLISMIPLTLTIAFIYGLIGIVGKDYDMPVAVLSALTLGISIDFAIHFCQRTRQIREGCSTWGEAVERVFEEPVRALLRNMVVISLGFVPLFFSPLVPYQTVGFFFAAIMAVSGMATLIVLPALMDALKARLGL